MKKWIYKSIFLIAFVVIGLFALPKKQVKALGADFAPILIKATWEWSSFEQENSYDYEYIVKYKIDGIIIIDYLNSFEYFLVTQGVLNSIVDSVILEDIQIEDNSTAFYVRITVSSALINHYYGGVENSNKFFTNNSAFYVYYDVYSEGYNEGWEKGNEKGYNRGYNEGYDEGRDDGYREGLDEGYDLGYGDGYNEVRSDLLKLVFIAIFIAIGTIIAVPIVFGVIAFILVRKKD